MSDKITDRCGHETGPECICDQRAGCSLFRASSHPFAETVATRWKRDPEFRAAMVEDSSTDVTEAMVEAALDAHAGMSGVLWTDEARQRMRWAIVAALAAAPFPEKAR